MSIVPILPFQQEDLISILSSRIQNINIKYQNLQYWKNLDVSSSTIRYFVGVDHVDYFDLYGSNGGSSNDGVSNDGSEEQDDSDNNAMMHQPALTISTSGAHALDNNALWSSLRTGLMINSSTTTSSSSSRRSSRRRPELVRKVHLDDTTKETVFSWCSIEKTKNHDDEVVEVERCEEEWRSLLI